MTTCLLITTMNRSDLLQHSLNRLEELTLPDEILVVDDGGNDHCEELCRQMSSRLPIRYLYTHNPGQSICSHARNVGLKNTDAEFIITSEPELLFVTDVVAQFAAWWMPRPFEVISAGTVHHVQQGGEENITTGWIATWCAQYKRDWLLDIGGWDESFPDPWGWEDTDLLTRLRESGVGQHIDLSVEVRHQWHPPGYCDQVANEAHFKSNLGKTVVNEDRDWGVVKPR